MSSLKQLVDGQTEIKNIIQKTQINFKKCSKQRRTRGYLETSIENIKELWAMFKNQHYELVKLASKEDKLSSSYFCNDIYAEVEDIYTTLKADMTDIIHETQTKGANSQLMSNTPIKNDIKLPKISIPQFTGGYHEWATFKDIYTSLIHDNTHISAVQKLHYLKSCVSGEAEMLLKHISITEDNYAIAWEALNQRFDNKKVIINSILQRLFNQRKLTTATSKGIKELFDTTLECLNKLNNLSINTSTWDVVIIYLIVNKLDTETHKSWEEEVGCLDSATLPTFQMFKHFLEKRFRVLELINPEVKEKVVKSKSFYVAEEPKCAFCKELHALYKCKEFSKLEVNKRCEFVTNNRLCYNCLAPNHPVKLCKSRWSCQRCHRKHHSLLHNNKQLQRETPTPASTSDTTEPAEQATILSHYAAKSQAAIMATALVYVGTDRKRHLVRALIDPCSQECFVNESTVKRLQLHRKAIDGEVSGVGLMKTSLKYAAEFILSSRFSTNFTLNITAYVVKQITDVMPATKVSGEKWTHLQHLSLADPTYHSPSSVDILLGVNVYTEILMNGLIKGNPGTPIAQQTQLGWILSGGSVTEKSQQDTRIVSMHLNSMLKKFWEIEGIENENCSLTAEEVRAEEIYQNTYTRAEDGKYIVKLPFKMDTPVLPQNSREIAERRLHALEKRLNLKPELRQVYNEVIREYLSLGHMEEVKKEENTHKIAYLPHHAVIRDDKDTTKVRVVFDASCRGNNGMSLNHQLLVGPSLQEELRHIIMRWRTHKIGFVADIVKMYRQIRVHRDDIDCQRILWRFTNDEPIRDYRLLTVTFGTACAPYLAIKTLKQVAKDEEKKYPLASKVTQTDFFVDDILSGSHSEEEAIKIQKQLTSLLKEGGFELQKWSSNSSQFMKSLEPEKRENITILEVQRKESIKTLGIVWNVKEDTLQVKINLETIFDKPITKRNVLSKIASLFDPMGWYAPVIVLAKIYMQKLWKSNLSWDDYLPDTLKEEWLTYWGEIIHLKDIKLNRWIGTYPGNQMELHGFADASTTAYAAVIYSRVVGENGEVHVTLLTSKTKVAPVKEISLPRLELCAAVLLIKLLKQVAAVLNVDNKNLTAWSDSQVTLAWIKGDPSRWTVFVKNRVIDIKNTLDLEWRYVNTKENPADPASRGLYPSQLKNKSIWWNGPLFLHEINLPVTEEKILETEMETRPENKKCMLSIKINEKEEEILTLLKKYSNLSKLLHIISYCYRWFNLKNKKDFPKYITTKEREEALIVCIKLSQGLEFQEEVEDLKRNKNIKNRSRLLTLNPFLDDKNILRVGGRLKYSKLDIEKHPIILSKNNIILPLLIKDAHNKTLHGGAQLIQCYLRKRYWIINGGQTIKRFVKHCMVCARQNATPASQIMGNLPDIRLKPARPFLITGVDYAGPILARTSKGRGVKSFKAYICLFVCMVTKALHLELVSDMTTTAFIAAFRRFTARRGYCKELWSDHGTTFIGSEKEIIKMWKLGQPHIPQDLAKQLDDKGTFWRYIPPGSPNFGGLWEAGVKSTKYHLKRIIGTSTLTFEELSTLLSQIEACLNSRPLSPLSDDHTDLDPLTPGHFLIGEPLVLLPDQNYSSTKGTNLERWQLLQRMLQDFWNKWREEYLTRLQHRPKWHKIQKEFEVGDLIVIKDNRFSPGLWPMGCILKKYPDKEGLTRVYDVKTATGVLQRSIGKLCRLPN